MPCNDRSSGTNDVLDIIDVLTRYATAVDHRTLDLLDDVFTEDLTFTRVRTPESIGRVGEYTSGDKATHSERGRANRVASIRSYLKNCGPTQHLLGNFVVSVEGDTASSVCAVRAYHMGSGANSNATYEVFGEYHDHLVRTDAGWRIAERQSLYYLEIGSASVLDSQ